MIFHISFLTILVLFFCWITHIKLRRLVTINNIFNFAWYVTLMLNIYYSIHHNLIIPSIQIIDMVSMIIFFFNITYLLFSKEYNVHVFDVQINYNIIKWFIVIAIILYLPNLVTSIKILFSNGFSFAGIRNEYTSLMGAGRGVYVYVTQHIPNGIANAIIIIAAYEFVRKRFALLPYIIFLILVNSISFGGRGIFLNIILYYAIIYSLIRKENINYKMNKTIPLLLIIVIVILTFSRGVGEEGFLGMFAKYFYEHFSFFQLALDNPTWFDLESIIHYGYISLGFLIAPFCLIGNMFNSNIQIPSYFIDIHSQIFYNIGTNSNVSLINNNITSIYTFLMDFGPRFYFIGAIILAFYIICAEKKLIWSKPKNRSFFLFLYIFIVKSIIYSPIYYGLSSISVSFLIIFLYFVTRNIKVKIISG